MNKKTGAEFVWPEFKTDRERIKAFSQKYRNMSIDEAFADAYGTQNTIKYDDRTNKRINTTPFEPRVGDLFDVSILSINKNNIVFDTLNLKTEIVSKVNLYKYDFFKKFVPTEPIKVMVSAIDKRKITVDPIVPLFDEWMCEYIGARETHKNILKPKIVKVKNLRLTRGGFMGDVSIKNVVDFIHEDYTVPAFIPGSQIVLNIAKNFEDYVGLDVDAFVINYMKNPITSEISLICSPKEYYKFLGDCNMIDMFNNWCEGNDYWNTVKESTFAGKVTGIINSSKKCGVFVEIPDLNITGLVTVTPDELVNYKPHTDINVKITGFDEETYYNPIVKQVQHVEPYIIEDNVLVKCNLKPVLSLA